MSAELQILGLFLNLVWVSSSWLKAQLLSVYLISPNHRNKSKCKDFFFLAGLFFFLIKMFSLQKLPYLCSTIILLSKKQGVFANNEVN